MRALALVLLLCCGVGVGSGADVSVVTSKFARLDELKVHYLDRGEGTECLLFVHGWCCDASFWRRQVDGLGNGVRSIAIDLPGHGDSDKPEIPYTMDLYARAIDAVLQDAKVERAVVVGHSNGVPAIRQFYRRYPAKTIGFVVVDGPLRPMADRAAMEKFIEPLRHLNHKDFLSDLIGKMVEPIKDTALRKEIKTAMLRTPRHVAVSEFEGAIDPAVWEEDKISVPTLLILAKQPSWSPEYEQFVRGLVPNVEYQAWEHVSHFIMMEKPQEFNDALSAFLRKNRLLVDAPHRG